MLDHNVDYFDLISVIKTSEYLRKQNFNQYQRIIVQMLMFEFPKPIENQQNFISYVRKSQKKAYINIIIPYFKHELACYQQKFHLMNSKYIHITLCDKLQQIYLIMDFLRMTAINTPNDQPRRRRRTNTISSVNSIIKNNIGGFLSFFQQTIKIANHKPTLKENQQMISLNFKKINMIIDNIDEHITNRMNEYQSQIYSIVKGQIEEMHKQNMKLIDTLNKKIEQKESQEELFNVYNELDYFKSEALKLFNQCKKLRIQNKMLEKQNKQYEGQRQNNNVVLQKMKKKYLRQKALKNKINLNNKSQQFDDKEKQKVIKKEQKGKRIKTTMDDVKQNKSNGFKRSVYEIKLGNKKVDMNDQESQIDLIDIDQLLDEPSIADKTPVKYAPALNIKKGYSEVFQQESSFSATASKLHRKDQSAQTEQQHLSLKVKNQSLLSIHQTNRRGFSQKSAFNSYQNPQASPYLDYNKIKLKVKRHQTPNMDKMMSQSFTKNKLTFGLAKDRYIQQKTFHNG